MLVKLLPDQVMHYWDVIKEGLEATLPPYVVDSPSKMESVQIALLGDMAQCWVYIDDTPSVIGIVVTRVVYDDFTDSTNLLIISIYVFQQTTGDIWVDGYETLRKYGLGKGCSQIIAYTNEPKILKIVELFGGKSEYTFITVPLQGD